MLVKKASDIRSSEITDKKLYLARREFIRAAALTTAGAAAGALGAGDAEAQSWPRVKIAGPLKDSGWGKGEKPNAYEDITTYNNYYEFGTEKDEPAQKRTLAEDEAVDGEDRRPGQQAGRLSARRHPEARNARRSHLSAAVRRAVVDGDSVGRLSAGEPAQAHRAEVEREVRRVHDAAEPDADAGVPGEPCSTGRTSKGCASTRPCTRSRFSRWACTVNICPTRTARRSGWWCPGSMVSRASSRSCGSA